MHRIISFSFLLGLAMLASSALAAEAPALPPHPRLLFNGEGIEQFKQKIQREPWRVTWEKELAVR